MAVQSRVCTLLACALLIGAIASHAFAQDGYPAKPVRLIAPFPPGGTTDVLCRLIAQTLSTAFGRQVIVDNRPGAAGSIGHDVAAKAPDVVERFESLGVFARHTTPEQMLETVKAEGPPMGKLLKVAGVQPQ